MKKVKKEKCNNFTSTCSNYSYNATFSRNSNTDDAW